MINRCVEKADGKTRYEHAFKREYKKVNLYGFLYPVVAAPANRKKDKHTMKLYKKLQTGLYLGRVERNNQNILMLEDGTIIKAHTVRNVSLPKAQVLRILNEHEKVIKAQKLEQTILDETGIGPKPDHAKLLASRATGSKTAWHKKSKEEQNKLSSMFGPTVRETREVKNLKPIETGIKPSENKLSDLRKEVSETTKQVSESEVNETPVPRDMVKELTDLGFKVTHPADHGKISSEAKRAKIDTSAEPSDTVQIRDLDKLKFDILDEANPTVLMDTANPQSQAFMSSDVDVGTLNMPLIQNKLLPNPNFVYMDGGDEDALQGYGIGSDGNDYY